MNERGGGRSEREKRREMIIIEDENGERINLGDRMIG